MGIGSLKTYDDIVDHILDRAQFPATPEGDAARSALLSAIATATANKAASDDAGKLKAAAGVLGALHGVLTGAPVLGLLGL